MQLERCRIERFYARYEFTTRYMLSSSDCESRTVGELLELEPGAQERLNELWCGCRKMPSSAQEVTITSAGIDQRRRRYEDGWAHDVDALARAVRPDTSLLYLNQPHNPTGR